MKYDLSTYKCFFVYKDVITKELLAKFEDAFKSSSSNVLAQNACTKFDPFQIALSRKRIEDQIIPDHYFSLKVNNIKIIIYQKEIIFY